MANPRKFSEKIALHNQKQAEETAAFEKIMREVSDATNKVNPNNQRARVIAPVEPVEKNNSTLRPTPQSLGSFRSGSLPNVAAPQTVTPESENEKPEEDALAAQYGLVSDGGGNRSIASPSRSPGQRGRASSSVGPMRRPADRKHDTSPYGSTVYLSPPPDSNWRRTNSDSALHQSCGEQQQPPPPLSPQLHPLLHHNLHPHHNHRRPDMHLEVLSSLGMNPAHRPRSSCEIPRIPNNNNVYDKSGEGGMRDAGGGGGNVTMGTLSCGDLQLPGGSLPDLTSVHLDHYQHHYLPQHHTNRYSGSCGAASPGAGSASPATAGLSPASGSPVGATVPQHHHAYQQQQQHQQQQQQHQQQQHHQQQQQHQQHQHQQQQQHTRHDPQSHLSVPNTNNYLHHNKNMSPLEHSWIPTSYQSHCSPPSQYSSTSNINIPSPTMVHSPGSPVESPQTDYSNLHQALLQPFEQITMDWAQLVQSLVESGWTAHVQVQPENLDQPVSNYNTTYINHSSPHSPQTTSTPHTYPQVDPGGCRRSSRDPVAGGGALSPAHGAPIPDIILTDYSGELDAGIFGGEEAQLRAGIDLDDLTLLEEPSALLPDSAVEHEFRLDRL